jgi:hypothetical protein
MSHTKGALDTPATADSAARHRFGLPALAVVALLSALTIWIATPLSATAGSRAVTSARSGPVTIDVIAKTTSFRTLPSDGFIATANLFDKRTGKQLGSDILYCLEVEPAAPAGSQTPAECPGTASFTGKGSVSVLGSFLVPPRLGQSWTVAVTGGTDRYRNVRGQLKVIQISPTEEEGIWTLLS